jgi:hypothetical protein
MRGRDARGIRSEPGWSESLGRLGVIRLSIWTFNEFE